MSLMSNSFDAVWPTKRKEALDLSWESGSGSGHMVVGLSLGGFALGLLKISEAGDRLHTPGTM